MWWSTGDLTLNTDLSLKYKRVWNQLIQESSWPRNWLIMIHSFESNFTSHAECLQDKQ